MTIQAGDIEYGCGDTTHRGYLACGEDHEGKVPGVLVIHEWWGLNDFIRQRCETLAELGYCALGLDMYGDGYEAHDPERAGAAMNAVYDDMKLAEDRLHAGRELLLAQPGVDPDRIGAIGYCFGGAMVLHMARRGIPLSAVVSFHGKLQSFHTPGAGDVKAKVLVCHGGDDIMVPDDEVAAFKAEMDHARADYRVLVHAGAKHGFTNAESDERAVKYKIPVGYDAAADNESWQAMQELFASVWG